MTPNTIIAQARTILSDTDTDLQRYSPDDLLGYVNDGLKEMVTIRPELFSTIGDYTCVAGQCEQSLRIEDAATLIEVLCIHGSTALTPFDLPVMDAFNPGWRADTAGAAQQWARFSNDPLRFYVYPKAPTGQVLDVRYIRLPAIYGADEVITEVPEIYAPALADYVIYRAESRDDEHVNSNRAAQFFQSFVAKVKG